MRKQKGVLDPPLEGDHGAVHPAAHPAASLPRAGTVGGPWRVDRGERRDEGEVLLHVRAQNQLNHKLGTGRGQKQRGAMLSERAARVMNLTLVQSRLGIRHMGNPAEPCHRTSIQTAVQPP